MFKERLLYVFFYFMLDEKLSNFQLKSMKIQYMCKLLDQLLVVVTIAKMQQHIPTTKQIET
jgi:hypothetical protein